MRQKKINSMRPKPTKGIFVPSEKDVAESRSIVAEVRERHRRLEDYEPGATREQVFEALQLAAQPIKYPAPKVKKCSEPPAQVSS